tara:strand:+ start:17187 stop:17501 length:315 start_codon:yes stop_codon:yes gene_type:complete
MGVKAWTEDEEEVLKEIYLTETKDIEYLCKKFGRVPRSITSKLVNMGIYEKPEKDKKENRTVKTMLTDLERMLDIEIEGFNLNKKANLLILVEALELKFEELDC